MPNPSTETGNWRPIADAPKNGEPFRWAWDGVAGFARIFDDGAVSVIKLSRRGFTLSAGWSLQGMIERGVVWTRLSEPPTPGAASEAVEGREG